MSHDRTLVNAIKANFARKSSAQLQEIVESKDRERWSAEAIIAADEVLRDRLVGRAQEPAVPEEDPPPPPKPPDALSLAFMAMILFGGMGSHVHFHFHVHPPAETDDPDPDWPLPFGPKIAWLALDSRDTDAVATALDLRDAHAATWKLGIEAAYESAVFVTPPLADWTLAAGRPLFPTDHANTFVKPLIERLSRQFGEAQYFCTHEDAGLHVWARARQGRLVRGHGWLGQKNLTLWDEGRPTKEELALGFRCSDGQCSSDAPLPDEEFVMQLANLWSIDPTALNADFKEPGTGLLGRMAAGGKQSPPP